MKLRVVKVALEQFVTLLQGKGASFGGSLPNDIELLDAKVDLFNRQVLFVIRSDSFEDISEVFPLPEFGFKEKSETKTIPSIVVSSKVDSKPVSSPSVAKPLQPPVSRYASKMENEFSPEQRKLLSFTVKDDCVVVKPVMFLKAEWDDINDIVKSLGGKWVKGDIISFWEIPL